MDCTTKDTKNHEEAQNTQKAGDSREGAKPQSKNVREIVITYLRDNNYEGLYYDDECGCELNDLMPCGNIDADCKPGYKTNCDPNTCIGGGGCAWHIGPKKESV